MLSTGPKTQCYGLSAIAHFLWTWPLSELHYWTPSPSYFGFTRSAVNTGSTGVFISPFSYMAQMVLTLCVSRDKVVIAGRPL